MDKANKNLKRAGKELGHLKTRVERARINLQPAGKKKKKEAS